MYLNNITAAKFKLCNIKKFSLQSIYKHAEKRVNTYNSLWMLRLLRRGFPNRWPALLQAWRLLHALFSYTEVKEEYCMDETLGRDTMHNIRETLDCKIQYDSIIFGL